MVSNASKASSSSNGAALKAVACVQGASTCWVTWGGGGRTAGGGRGGSGGRPLRDGRDGGAGRSGMAVRW